MSEDCKWWVFLVENEYVDRIKQVLPEGFIKIVSIGVKQTSLSWKSPFESISTYTLGRAAVNITELTNGSKLNWHHTLLDLLQDEQKTRSIITIYHLNK